MSVGMPAWLKLNDFGRTVLDAFPDAVGCYHVGSSLRSKEWRDVDVRLLLPDDVFERYVGEHTDPRCLNPRWNALCLAFAIYGAHMTGLNIDFQIDQQTWANEKYGNSQRYPRSALGVLW